MRLNLPLTTTLLTNPVGTRSTASEPLMREIPDAVERVPTQWFMGSKRENLFRRDLSPSDGERESTVAAMGGQQFVNGIANAKSLPSPHRMGRGLE